MSGKKKISKVAIDAALKVNPNLEFIDAVTGQWTTTAEAKTAGARQLNVRYNDDRDVHVITL